MLSDQQLGSGDETLFASIDDLRSSSHDTPSNTSMTPKEIAEYSADMLEQLRDLAQKSDLTFLAYLIQVALEEAKIQAGDEDER